MASQGIRLRAAKAALFYFALAHGASRILSWETCQYQNVENNKRGPGESSFVGGLLRF